MTAEELWDASGLVGYHEAWAFGDAPDALAELVCKGVKTATSSAYATYECGDERLPEVGDYSVILDSHGSAVCIVRTTSVSVVRFDQVTAEHAFKEGEDDRSLSSWRRVHEDFFTRELAELGLTFNKSTKVVCEEFELTSLRTRAKRRNTWSYHA